MSVFALQHLTVGQLSTYLMKCQVNIYIQHCKLFWRKLWNFPFHYYFHDRRLCVHIESSATATVCALPNKLHSRIYNEVTTVCMYRFVLNRGTQQVVQGSLSAVHS